MRQPVQYGKYLLLDRISVGGMAEVFRAKSFGVEGFEKILALKRILPSLGEDEDFIKMFIDEANIAGQLTHANIGQIHELGHIDGSHFISMEYISGRDLLQVQNKFRKAKKRISPEMACFIVMKLCEALDYAHRKRDVYGVPMQIVHRDCSPQNVLVSYQGEVKLIDFGIAKAASRSSRTNAGVLKGKFGYMSPEQVRGLPLDRRSDIFALGTILFETLTGGRLFLGESDFSTLEKVRHAQVDQVQLSQANIPRDVESIILKALSRGVADRYQSCGDMRDALNHYLRTKPKAFTNRLLGEQIREIFVVEFERESKLLDSYRGIGRDGNVGLPRAPSKADVLVGGSQPAAPKPPEREQFEDKPTEIFGELGVAELLGASPSVPEAEEEKVQIALAPNSFDGEDAETNPGDPVLDRYGANSPQGQRVSAEHMVQPPMVTAQVPILAKPVLPIGQPMGVPMPGKRTPSSRRSQGHVMIGVSIAVALLAAFVTGKLFFFGDDGKALAEAPKATLVVLMTDKQAGEVWVGSKRFGLVSAGDPLTLETVPPGSHKISIRRDGVERCASEIELGEGEVEVYECAPAGAHGTLLLRGALAGDSVVIDGVKRADPAGPLSLSTGGSHFVAVTRDHHLIDEFRVTAEADEEVTHTLPLPTDAGVAEPDAEPAKVPVLNTKNPDVDKEEGQKKHPKDEAEKKDKPPTIVKPPNTVEKKPVDDKKNEPDDKKNEPELDYGYFTAFSQPWARVLIDGKDTGKVTPISASSKLKLKTGSHRVTFVVGDKKHNFTIDVKPGQTSRLAKKLN